MTGLANTGTLIRMILRRDRIRIPVWIVATVILVVGSAASFPETYPTVADRQSRGDLVDSPATRMLIGPAFGVDNYTYGAMLANEMLGITAIVMALMSIFTVVRHTRADEEVGRLDLVRSSPVGRHAGLTAVLVVVVAMNLLIAGLLILLLPASLSELSAGGTVLFAVSLAVTGIVFAAVAAVLAQVNEFSRAAIGTSAGLMGIAYAVRGFGDVSGNALVWLSPFGWAQQTAPYVLDRWWPLVLSIGLIVVLVPLAYHFSVRRDVGAGLLAPQPGPAHAPDALSQPLGTPLRLQRTGLIGWTAGVVLFATGIGGMAPSVADMIRDNPSMRDMFLKGGASESDVVDQVLSVYVSFFAMLIAIFAVGAIVRLRTEESAGRAENILATRVSRGYWAGEYLAFSIVGSTGVLLLAGIGAGVTYAVSTGDTMNLLRLVGASLVYAPALWLTVGIALGVFGIAPKLMILAWVIPAYAFAGRVLVPMLGLPDAFMDLSPFEHVPAVLTPGFTVVPMIVMTLLGIACIAVGLAGLGKRDMEFG